MTGPGNSISIAEGLLACGPLVVIAVWIANGQLTLALPEARAWLWLSGAISAATLMPMPGRPVSLAGVLPRARALAWLALAGLLMTA